MEPTQDGCRGNPRAGRPSRGNASLAWDPLAQALVGSRSVEVGCDVLSEDAAQVVLT